MAPEVKLSHPAKLKDMYTALVGLSETDCESSVKAGLLDMLDRWTEQRGFTLAKYNSEYVALLLKLLHSDTPDVSKQVCLVLDDCLQLETLPEGPPLEVLGPPTLNLVKGELMPVLKARLEDSGNSDWREVFRCWDVLVRLLGRHLHRGTELINTVMSVVERGFKLGEAAQLDRSFQSWMVLMDNFALDRKILTAKRRVELMVRPFLLNNARSEASLKVKFTAWWHLISLLGPDDSAVTEPVIIPFLRFCYGPAVQPGSSPGTPGTPSSPARRHSALERLCLEAVLQVVAGRPGDLPASPLSSQLPGPAFPGLQFVTHFRPLMHAVTEASQVVNPGSRSDMMRLGAVWEGVAGRLAGLWEEGDSSRAAVKPAVLQYQEAVRSCCNLHRRTERLHPLLASILDSAARLPAKLLTCTIEGGQRVLGVLVELVLHPDLLRDPANTEQGSKLVSAFTRLMETSISCPGPTRQLEEVLDRLQLCADNLGPAGLPAVTAVWCVTAAAFSGRESMADSPAGPTTAFTAALRLLVWPVLQRSEADAVWPDWERCYSALAEQAEVSVSHSSGAVAGELAARLESGLNHSLAPSALLCRIARVLVERADWASLSRNLKTSEAAPLAGFQRFLRPLGILNSLVSLLARVAVLLTEAAGADNTAAISHLLAAYQALFKVPHDNLIRPLLRLASPALALFLPEAGLQSMLALQPALWPQLESVITAASSLISVRYSGQFSPEFLTEVEQFLSALLASPRPAVRKVGIELWSVTFASLEQSTLPARLAELLGRAPEPAPLDSSNSGSFTQQLTMEPGIAVGLRGCEPSLGPGPTATPPRQSAASPAPTRRNPRKSLNLRLEDEDSALFVPIKTTPKGKRVLTDHQKEVLTTRKDDIPALYSELSRDGDSLVQLPAEFANQDSQSQSVAMKPEQTVIPDTQDVALESSDFCRALEKNESLSLLKQRKNKRFEAPDNSLRRSKRKCHISIKKEDNGRVNSPSKLNKEISNVDSVQMIAEAVSNELVDNAVVSKENDKSYCSNKVPEETTADSVSSVDDLIESSQDVTMAHDKSRTRRARRRLNQIIANGNRVLSKSTSEDEERESLPSDHDQDLKKSDKANTAESNDVPGVSDVDGKSNGVEEAVDVTEKFLEENTKSKAESGDKASEEQIDVESNRTTVIKENETLHKSVTITNAEDLPVELGMAIQDNNQESVTLTPLTEDTETPAEDNKENLTSSEETDTEAEKPKKKELSRIKSPFTAMTNKQKSSLNPGSSRGAMLLNLSRKVNLEGPKSNSSPTVMVSPKVERTKQPWVKYAPSPSHASPSVSILKRPADDLDSSTESSPVSAKRIRLDGSFRRVHFNENPVSESVEIPRTPSHRKPRKKLQLSLAGENSPDDCSLPAPAAICPRLTACTESISTILHNLAPGQWAKILEADLRERKVGTVGELASLNAVTIKSLRGVKPPRVATVEGALKAFIGKCGDKCQDNFSKDEGITKVRAPVEEETSQEEEDEIKAAIFSRPSPSPTDMGDVDIFDEVGVAQDDNSGIESDMAEEEEFISKNSPVKLPSAVAPSAVAVEDIKKADNTDEDTPTDTEVSTEEDTDINTDSVDVIAGGSESFTRNEELLTRDFSVYIKRSPKKKSPVKMPFGNCAKPENVLEQTADPVLTENTTKEKDNNVELDKQLDADTEELQTEGGAFGAEVPSKSPEDKEEAGTAVTDGAREAGKVTETFTSFVNQADSLLDDEDFSMFSSQDLISVHSKLERMGKKLLNAIFDRTAAR